MTQSLFSDQETPDQTIEDKDYASELIGDGKRFKDISALARAKVESDAFIERLKAENAEMRGALKGEAKITEFLDKLNTMNKPPLGNASSDDNQSSQSNQNQNTQIKSLSLEEVQAMLDEREKRSKEEQNLSYVNTEVRKAFGANAGSVLKAKAAELGMTEQDLTDLAKVRPAAFLKLVEASVQGTTGQAPRSSVNTTSISNQPTGTKNNKYYTELRKKMGDADFFKPSIQNEMFRSAKELGEAFYS